MRVPQRETTNGKQDISVFIFDGNQLVENLFEIAFIWAKREKHKESKLKIIENFSFHL